MSKRGYLIVIEGPDGSGKSTLARQLCAWLDVHDVPVAMEAFPSADGIGQFVRRILSGEMVRDGGVLPKVMSLLFAADHFDRMATIDRLLDAGTTVIVDRYTPFSGFVYQSVTAGLKDPTQFDEKAAQRTLDYMRGIYREYRQPDVTLVLMPPPGLAEKRMVSRGTKREIYEDVVTQRHVLEWYGRGTLLFGPDTHIIGVAERSSPSDIRKLAVELMREHADLDIPA